MINLKEAAKLSGKGLTTITRLARKYQDSKHVKKQAGQYLISKELVNQIYPPVNHVANQNNQENETGLLDAKNETIAFLKSELEQKNRQINELTERIRENNIIIQNLQTRLQIPESFTEHQEINQEPQPDHPHPHHTTEKHKQVIIELIQQGGYTHRQVADYLNQHGYTNSRGSKFTKNAIEKILSRMRKKSQI